MSECTQYELPVFSDMRRLGEERNGKRERSWYYLCKPARQEMAAIDSEGRYCWIAHDTTRIMPHLFSNRRTAIDCASRMKGVRVLKYPYPVR